MTKATAVLPGILRHRYVRTWLLLVVLAVITPIVGIAWHGDDVQTGDVAAVVVLALAAYKVRLVGLDFMELRSAPPQMRLVFEAYCLGLWLLLSGAFVLL